MKRTVSLRLFPLLLALAAVLGTLAASPNRIHAAAGIEVYGDRSGTIACISGTPGELVEVYFVATGDVDLSSVSFQVFQGCWDNGYLDMYWLVQIPVFPQTEINQGIVAVDFEQCLPPPIHVLTALVLVVEGSGYACPGYCTPENALLDCAGASVTPTDEGGTRLVSGLCRPTAPHDPDPPDGSVGVSPDVELRWASEAAETCWLGEIPYYDMYFGETNPPPYYGWWSVDPRGWDPGELNENSTYYWRVETWQYGYVSSSGPVWSFTTGGAVPVRLMTWGRIKALYE